MNPTGGDGRVTRRRASWRRPEQVRPHSSLDGMTPKEYRESTEDSHLEWPDEGRQVTVAVPLTTIGIGMKYSWKALTTPGVSLPS